MIRRRSEILLDKNRGLSDLPVLHFRHSFFLWGRRWTRSYTYGSREIHYLNTCLVQFLVLRVSFSQYPNTLECPDSISREHIKGETSPLYFMEESRFIDTKESEVRSNDSLLLTFGPPCKYVVVLKRRLPYFLLYRRGLMGNN